MNLCFTARYTSGMFVIPTYNLIVVSISRTPPRRFENKCQGSRAAFQGLSFYGPVELATDHNVATKVNYRSTAQLFPYMTRAYRVVNKFMIREIFYSVSTLTRNPRAILCAPVTI